MDKNQKKYQNNCLKNPKVEISGMSKGTWIRLEAILVEDDRLEAKEHMIEANPSLKRYLFRRYFYFGVFGSYYKSASMMV